MLPLASQFQVHLLGTGLPSFWVADMGDMIFQGQVIGKPYKGGREISDIIYFGVADEEEAFAFPFDQKNDAGVVANFAVQVGEGECR